MGVVPKCEDSEISKFPENKNYISDLQIMKSFNRSLKENGKLYLFVPAKMILWTKLDEIVGHYRRYEISNLKSLALQSGFKIERIHYADFCGFFITLLWKL